MRSIIMIGATSFVAVNIIIIIIVIITSNVLVPVCAQEADKAQQLSEVRGRFKLPSVFSFDRFKGQFGKVYNSFLEELVRQKIFLGRAFKGFISFVKYKHFQSSHYLSVNPNSDETPEERKRRRISVSFIREPLDELAATDQASLIKVPEQDELPVAELDDIEREFAELDRQRSERPELQSLVEELEEMRIKTKRKKRSTEGKGRKVRLNVSVDELLIKDKTKVPSEVAIKIRTKPVSNNPNYEQPELSSSASSEQLAGVQKEAPNEGFMNLVSKLPGVSYVKSVIDSSLSSEPDQANQVELEKENNPNLPDEVFSDLRQTNCFLPVRTQTQCGCCYAFTVIAYYEYLYCRHTGSLVPFSEQYIVDCGYLNSLKGCAGGLLSKTVGFVEQFGLELRNNYPYRALEDICPYEENPNPEHMGYIKLSNKNGYGALAIKNFDLYLKEKPIMFGLKLAPDFQDYGGGVDDAIGCSEEDGHAMLIVGHGREDGKDYYLFRNSYSDEWGEQGYYKLNKASLERCAANSFGVASQVKFKKSELKNRNTKHKIMKTQPTLSSAKCT